MKSRYLLAFLLAGLAHGQTTTQIVDCSKGVPPCLGAVTCSCYEPSLNPKATMFEASKAKVDAIPAQQPKEFVWILGAASNGNYEATKKACDMARERYGTDTEMRIDGCYVKIFTEPPPHEEATDVPAIKGTHKECVEYESLSWGGIPPCKTYHDFPIWTCEKGSGRIYMEDVDGGKHCIRFPKGPKQ